VNGPVAVPESPGNQERAVVRRLGERARQSLLIQGPDGLVIVGAVALAGHQGGQRDDVEGRRRLVLEGAAVPADHHLRGAPGQLHPRYQRQDLRGAGRGRHSSGDPTGPLHRVGPRPGWVEPGGRDGVGGTDQVRGAEPQLVDHVSLVVLEADDQPFLDQPLGHHQQDRQ